MGKAYVIPALLLMLMPVAADPIAPEVLHLARIKSRAKQGLSSIPAYTCSEVMERSTRAKGRVSYARNDELRFEVAEIGGRELFSKPGEKNFSEMAVKEYSNRGLMATGMFASMAQTVFGSPVAQFHYVGVKRIKGHKALQYEVSVSPLFANYHLNFNYHEAKCGFKGSIWADETSFDLIRLRVEATDVPAELLLNAAITEIDYARTSFDGSSYLIPSSAEITTIFFNGNESRNQLRFSNCRKYGVESTITFQ